MNSILCERKFLAESKDISYRITLGNDLRLDFLEELDLISIVGNLLITHWKRQKRQKMADM